MDSQNTPTSMFTAIHHDRNNSMVFVWYAGGARKVYKTRHRFYTPIQGEYNSKPSGMKDIYGKPVYEAVVSGKEEMEIRQKHSGKRNNLSELDIDYRTRWLQLNYQDTQDIRFSMSDFNICYLDIEVATKGKFPTAQLAEYPINVVTIYFSKEDRYYCFGLNREIKDETKQKLADAKCTWINCPTEADLLTQLFTTIGTGEVDILTGWNCDFFDIPYLVNRATKLGVDINLLSRLPGNYKSAYVSKRDDQLKIGGTEVIDHLKLYRKFNLSERDNYKLDTIGFTEVGERKAPLPDGYMSYIKYWDEFVWYNFKDCELLVKIENKKRMFETTIGACAEARVPFASIFEAKKMLVGFILNYLHRRNIVMPPLRENEREAFPGAYVYSTPGYYECLVSYDYRSMYPSIMMGANISPETKVTYPIDATIPDHVLEGLVRSPWTANGKRQVFYRKDVVGIVPDVVRVLFDGRTMLKNMKKKAEKAGNSADASYYDMKQQTYKILGNSLYGLLGNPYFQFYDIDNSASVTAFGRELITSTIAELTEYIENEFETDPIYPTIFDSTPKLSRELFGTFFNEDDEECYKRMSHGDTDSFFVKYDDIYQPYKDLVGKKVGVFVFKKNALVHKSEWDMQDDVIPPEAKRYFNNACKQYISYWDKTENDKKVGFFEDGLIFDGEYRVIFNRYSLTDFCRILDASIMESKLAEIMDRYASKWNYKENTLFLKREKCIRQAIVTAKKKYICYVESNEDVKYKELKFAITGLEIVRSSTTPFARKRILDLVKTLLKDRNKAEVRAKYLTMKTEFYDLVHENNLYEIAQPSGVKATPPKWLDYRAWPIEDKKKLDWRLRAGSVWNHLIEHDEVLSEIALEPIFEGSKVKFIKVAPNDYGISTLAFVGDKCPDRLLEIFTPNWDAQWKTGFAQTMGRLFKAVGWGENLEYDERDLMRQIF